ncbi:hypothetical protein SAMN04488542_10293 [Fontibacillus panacisegetis]|uniref:DUF4190 domain-containing protein n=1 Tax=Fontibacillus panacisegetis TaxID=670482 RepID=A0A1G7FQ51_9BACL|nr:hypothetical protein [Fontibacillus panacisegetis]SDE78002.1 hypothetical protein SAMN04488542_10293 [Fontibacillus panacisegetis]
MSDYNKHKPHHPASEKKRIDYPRKTHQEEYAAEVMPMTGARIRSDRDEVNRTNREILERSEGAQSDVEEGTAGRTVGYIGVGLGIASLFIWSIVLGPIAAIMGFYAYSQGRKTAGAWAIGLGIVATLSYFVLMPFTR